MHAELSTDPINVASTIHDCRNEASLFLQTSLCFDLKKRKNYAVFLSFLLSRLLPLSYPGIMSMERGDVFQVRAL